jgi:hypothetical protein
LFDILATLVLERALTSHLERARELQAQHALLGGTNWGGGRTAWKGGKGRRNLIRNIYMKQCRIQKTPLITGDCFTLIKKIAYNDF